MNADQKQRIAQAVSNWRSYDLQEAETVTENELSAMCSSMAALLQELVDAPEPKPVAWRYEDAFGTHFTEDYSEISNIPGVLSFTALFAAPPHQSEHHLEMVNTPAPTQAEPPADVARDARLQVESEFAALLPGVTYMDEPDGGTPTVQEQIARMAMDAERYRWLRTHGLQRAWVSLGTDFEGDNFASFRCEFNVPEPPNLPHEDDEGLQWADKDFDAAIDAARERQGGES